MTGSRRAARAALVLLAALATVAVPAGRAAGAPRALGDNCPQPPQDQSTAWAQQLLSPDRAWVLSRGTGKRIALLDSGVDAGQPQLSGRVDAGYDAVAGSGSGNTDCLGTGTEVAGVMVAQQAGNSGLVGIAPDARVVPVRVVANEGFGNPTVDPGVLARGIGWAVDQHVDVICVSVAVYVDDPRVAQAVQAAEAANIPVIAAAGDRGGPNDSDPPPYPASYTGVLGVGAIDQTGNRWPNSGHGGYLDLAAPGANVLTTWRGQAAGVSGSGTGLAAGFVAATAALVERRWSNASVPLSLAQVRAQLRATAMPSPAGPRSDEYGVGVVNPYGAVSELASSASPAAPAGYTPRTPSQAERDWAAAWTSSQDTATLLAGVALVLVLLVMLAALAIPRGLGRAWRPTLAAPPVDEPEQDEPGPPLTLFEDS